MPPADILNLPDNLRGSLFDIVYSWGVLHHTGDLWRAIECVSAVVSPQGLLVIAIYRKTPLCAFWRREKAWYSSAPPGAQAAARFLYNTAFYTAKLVSGRNPFKARVRRRGMSDTNDVHDWLGGYPYESATPEEVRQHLQSLGFQKVREFLVTPHAFGLFGTGCDEYVYQKISYPHDAQRHPGPRHRRTKFEKQASTLAQTYRQFYEALCGRHPNLLPWHFQWMSTRAVRDGIRRGLSYIPAEAAILDVGCGASPYRAMLPASCRYTGMDLAGGEGAPDIVIDPEKPWPLPDAGVEAVLFTEVLEHVTNPALTLSEIRRVLKPGGTLVMSVPFIYGEHGMPYDFRRFTVNGLAAVLAGDYEIRFTERLGGVGTVLSTLFLNWIYATMVAWRPFRYAQPFLLPIWLVLSLGTNIAGLVLDTLDRTGGFYYGQLVVAVRK